MPKKGKKEAEKERIAEEERLRLVEEARIQKEKEDREREIALTKNKEAVQAIIKNDMARLIAEKEEISNHYSSKSTELMLLTEKISKEIEWANYLQCPYLPNAKIEKDVITYLKNWQQQEIDIDDQPSLETFFKEFPNVDLLASQLEYERCELYDLKQHEFASKVRDNMIFQRQILFQKFDFLTAYILQHMEYFNLEPNENFMVSSVYDNRMVGIWGNVTKNPRFKSIDVTDTDISMTIPKPLSLENVAIRLYLDCGPDAHIEFENHGASGNHLSVVGGVLHLDLLELPEVAKVVEKWTIRPMLFPDYKLKHIEYPMKKENIEQSDETDESVEKDASSDLFNWTSLVHYSIPKGCFIDSKSASIMFWNKSTLSWDNDNITDTDYDVESGKVRFRSLQFAPTALVQNAFGEFPLQEWSLEATEPNRSILTIKEIGQGKCKLISPNIPGFTTDNNEWLPPTYLFKRLSFYGYNFTAPKSLKGVEIDDFILKNPKLEEELGRGIAYSCPCFFIKSSASNTALTSNKAVFQFKEALDGASLHDIEGWKNIIYDVGFSIGEEELELGYIFEGDVKNSSVYLASNAESSPMKVSVYHLLKSQITAEDNAQKLGQFSASFNDTLMKVFTIARLICFT